jgi:hypothetical protein
VGTAKFNTQHYPKYNHVQTVDFNKSANFGSGGSITYIFKKKGSQ